MAEEISKIYDPKTIEKQADSIWVKGNHFHAEASSDKGESKKAYTIVIPPPNVTAPLHLGHALNNTLQDIMIRFHRMQQFETLWMPGTDHAGIATQTVVDKRLRAEGKPALVDYKKMEAEGEKGREEFVGRVQAWKDEYEAQIIAQLKAMGCSCDWERIRFTMDDVCAKAVRTNFFRLFKDGLIYRGKRLVNWDPATQTVLADDEVEHEMVQGHFWYLQYPLVEPIEIDGEQIEHITVATTRPETMLGDTAIAMNPSDPRAKELVGKKVRLPIVGRIIPIIADEHVVLPDPDSEDDKAKFSTGFLKVTPAHDPDDYAIGERHIEEIAAVVMPKDCVEDARNYVFINVMAPDGSISDKFGWEDAVGTDAEFLLGMDRYEAREAIVEWFRQEKLLEDVREYAHEIGHSYRSHVAIEPYLSDQWYVAVKKPIEHLGEKFGTGLIERTDVPVNSLAGLALKPLLDGKLRFIPERYAKTYQGWLENLRDWPISRQLWWGHQIPIWVCGEENASLDDKLKTLEQEKRISTQTYQEKLYACVSESKDTKAVKILEKAGYVRDEDVLDTWFSSALWPFSTMGWPDETAELERFYPGDVLCTAREIITLWVSRMVMMGQYCVGKIPFKDVFIHAMIQDGQGRKMSKSLGNGIDPLVVIDSHGTDAMRFTLASMTTDTQDVRMPVEAMTLPDGREVNTSPKFDLGRNFCNKLWNASRFAMMNLEGTDPKKFDIKKMTIADKWILSRLSETSSDVTKALNEFKFSEPLTQAYRFFWNDFCDWYLEWAKPRMRDEQQKPIAQNVLAFVLDQILRLLHPFVPFITEGIFQNLNAIAPVRGLKGVAEINGSEALVSAVWPGDNKSLRNEDIEKQITVVQTAIRTIRDLRSKYNKKPGEKLIVSINSSQEISKILDENSELVCQLANLEEFTAAQNLEKPEKSAAMVVEQMQVYLHDAIDIEAEKKRLEKQKQQIENAKKGVEAKLANENFVNKAKAEVVEQARNKLTELTEQLKAIEDNLSQLAS
ncbi:MAG: valine--tRNA ligase [Planctomycetes bacterium]|nr:valine--tRNA ligase [Planctomycetota bacterium]